jgi:hypothetical protein
LYLGVSYHLRYQLLALDILHDHVAGDTMVFQSMIRGSPEIAELQDDYDFWQTDILALADLHNYTPALGICQWFHFEDHRLDDAVLWLRKLGVTYVRIGLNWSDSVRPDAMV